MSQKRDHTWKLITEPFHQKLHEAMQQQHHAAQFIALAGRHLISRQPDDSNTSMQYVSEMESLVGNRLKTGIRIALHLTDFMLYLLDDHRQLKKELMLEGKSKERAFEELRQILGDSGMDVSAFKNKLHFEIPEHPLDKGSPFFIQDHDSLRENAAYRHNAEIILNDLAEACDHSPPVRIWPHHFDAGTYLPLDTNEEDKVTRSIGLGWAIPDDMVNEPSYFLNLWSEQPVSGFKDLSALPAGEWITSGWKGGVLKHSVLLTRSKPGEQYDLVSSFFNSGIDVLMQFK